MTSDQQSSTSILHNDVTYIRESVDELKTQAKITNGRVSALERWRAYIIGFCACVTMLLFPVVFYALTRIIDALRF